MNQPQDPRYQQQWGAQQYPYPQQQGVAATPQQQQQQQQAWQQYAYQQQQQGYPYPGYGHSYQQPKSPKQKKGFLKGVSKKTLLFTLGGIVLVSAVVAVSVILLFSGPVLQKESVEQNATQILEDEYGRSVDGVSCPDSQPVEPSTFTCKVTTGSSEKSVEIQVVDDQGKYIVGDLK